MLLSWSTPASPSSLPDATQKKVDLSELGEKTKGRSYGPKSQERHLSISESPGKICRRVDVTLISRIVEFDHGRGEVGGGAPNK